MQIKRFLMGTMLVGGLVLSGCGGAPTGTPVPPTTAAENAPPATDTPPAPTNTAGPPAALTKVTLALDWTPNTNHTGFYAAMQKGWYRDKGIDLQVLPYAPEGASPDTLVAGGKADFGISFVESVVGDKVTGLAVKSVAAIAQHDTSELASLKSAGLDRPAKLEGKRYGGFGSPYEDLVIADIIKHDGGKTGEIQDITTSVGGLQALEAKQVDFVWIYKGWEAIQAKHGGVALNEFLVTDYGRADYYSPVVIASEQFLRDKADLGKRFMAATSKGFEFAIQRPDEAADLLISANTPDTFPDKPLVHESARYLATIYQDKAPRWGEQTLKVWSDYPSFMVHSGKLEDQNHKPVTTDLDYGSLFTNELLP
ncbi:MAG: ABC transporter substrate-binding protein [Chloroflexia bacterium]